VRSARVLIFQAIDHEIRQVDQTTRLLGIHVLPREGPAVAANSRADRVLGELLNARFRATRQLAQQLQQLVVVHRLHQVPVKARFL